MSEGCFEKGGFGRVGESGVDVDFVIGFFGEGYCLVEGGVFGEEVEVDFGEGVGGSERSVGKEVVEEVLEVDGWREGCWKG